MSWRSRLTTKESTRPHTRGPYSDRCLRKATQGRCESVLARLTPGPVMRRQGESAISADRSTTHRCGNSRVVSADHESPGRERSSSCQTQTNRRRVISSCRKGGWRQPKKNLIGMGIPTRACVDDEGCFGSGAPESSPSVEKETALRKESEKKKNHTSRVRDEEVMDLAAIVGSRDECSRERTQLRGSVKESSVCRKLANHRVGCGGRTRFSNESTTPSQQHLVRQCDVAGEVGQKRWAHHRIPTDVVSWAHAGIARKGQVHFRSAEARGVSKGIVRELQDLHQTSSLSGTRMTTRVTIRSQTLTAMKLKIKDQDHLKKLCQQSRTTSTHSPVLSKEAGTMPAE